VHPIIPPARQCSQFPAERRAGMRTIDSGSRCMGAKRQRRAAQLGTAPQHGAQQQMPAVPH